MSTRQPMKYHENVLRTKYVRRRSVKGKKSPAVKGVKSIVPHYNLVV